MPFGVQVLRDEVGGRMTDAVAGTTGRYLVLLEDDSADAGMRAIADVAGLRPVSTAETAGASLADLLAADDGLLLHDLGVAVVTAAEDQLAALTGAAARPGPIAHVEAERAVHAVGTPAPPAEPASSEHPGPADETTCTWGLRAVRAPDSTATGEGYRVAVLDTGVDLHHPDLAGRAILTSSFVAGEDVQDGHGHGTHCIGTACGPRHPDSGPGYGLAYRAEICAGKVLSDQGSGADGGILAGIAWAITSGCTVVSMSLGAPAQPGRPYSRTFEQIGRRALDRGTLIVAAAGNESKRSQGVIAPVGHPANCPSILAVGALDVHGAVADFSCGSAGAAAVDLAGPGVDVYSSWPMPARYRRISGTSMATPHVAGIATLTAQAHNARAWAVWARLGQAARRLPLFSSDVGAGLVQAP
jgi:subtilisin family serine protease